MTDWNLVEKLTFEVNEQIDAMQHQFEIIKIYDQPPKLKTKIDLMESAKQIKALLDQAIDEACKTT